VKAQAFTVSREISPFKSQVTKGSRGELRNRSIREGKFERFLPAVAAMSRYVSAGPAAGACNEAPNAAQSERCMIGFFALSTPEPTTSSR
jgi:hypothetical protein